MRFIITNLPNIYMMEDFIKIDEEVFYTIVKDPAIFCFDHGLWLKLIKVWSEQSEAKLLGALDKVQMNLLSKKEIKRLASDNVVNASSNILEMVIAKIEGRNTAEVNIKFYPISSTSNPILKYCKSGSLGLVLHYCEDKIV